MSATTAQGWALVVQNCATGRTQDVSSKVPARRPRPGLSVRSLQIRLLQAPQDQNVDWAPDAKVRVAATGSPATTSRDSDGSTRVMLNGLPVRFWQRWQWQM